MSEVCVPKESRNLSTSARAYPERTPNSNYSKLKMGVAALSIPAGLFTAGCNYDENGKAEEKHKRGNDSRKMEREDLQGNAIMGLKILDLTA